MSSWQKCARIRGLLPLGNNQFTGVVSVRALRLKKNEERRLRAGHLWVFSNEVDVSATPLTDRQSDALHDIKQAFRLR